MKTKSNRRLFFVLAMCVCKFALANAAKGGRDGGGTLANGKWIAAFGAFAQTTVSVRDQEHQVFLIETPDSMGGGSKVKTHNKKLLYLFPFLVPQRAYFSKKDIKEENNISSTIKINAPRGEQIDKTDTDSLNNTVKYGLRKYTEKGKKKVVILIRHAESQFNEWIYNKVTEALKGGVSIENAWEKAIEAAKANDDTNMDESPHPLPRDADLTEKGKKQATELNKILKEKVNEKKTLDIDLLLMSPLKRAVKTASLGFADIPKIFNAKKVKLYPEIAELRVSISDVGTPTDKMKIEFRELFLNFNDEEYDKVFEYMNLYENDWWFDKKKSGAAERKEKQKQKETDADFINSIIDEEKEVNSGSNNDTNVSSRGEDEKEQNTWENTSKVLPNVLHSIKLAGSYGVYSEEQEQFIERVNNFRNFLADRKEEIICIVGHSVFFNTLLGLPLKNFMKNAEMNIFVFEQETKQLTRITDAV